jgi:hypothetical protein
MGSCFEQNSEYVYYFEVIVQKFCTVMPAGLHMLPILGLTSMKWTLLKTLALYLN